MKKNIMLRLSAVLLVAVLLTTCVISGTWAKYTTTDTGKDSVKVAKWGVTVEVTPNDNTSVQDTNVAEVNETHIISNTGELLAPGTKGEFANISIAGQPDVAVSVKYTATVDLGANWVVGNENEYYCPIKVYVDGVAVEAGANADAYEANIKAAIEKNTKTEVAAGESLAQTVKITWEWAFEGDNVKDTALGDSFKTDATKRPAIEIDLTVTVTQID